MLRIDDGAKYIISTLKNNGFSAYIVGGCVRDLLMGNTPHDIDITTNAEPKDVISLFNNSILTGEKFGTVTVICNKNKYEVTTFRTESGYSDLRRPDKVEFIKDIKGDLSRRDFTINAMAYNDYEGLIDLFGGGNDIKNRLIKTVNSPIERFNEDALRMLRAVRFALRLGFEIENSTLNAIKELSYLISGISKERVLCELQEIFNYSDCLDLLFKSKLYKYIGFDFCDIEEKSKQIKKITKPDFYKVTALLLYNVKSSLQILKDLKCSNITIKKISAIINGINFELKPNKVSVKNLLKACGDDNFYEIAELKSILFNKKVNKIIKIYNSIIKNRECYLIKDLAVDGNDLKKLNIEDKNIGSALNFLLNHVILNPSHNKKDFLLELFKKNI